MVSADQSAQIAALQQQLASLQAAHDETRARLDALIPGQRSPVLATILSTGKIVLPTRTADLVAPAAIDGEIAMLHQGGDTFLQIHDHRAGGDVLRKVQLT